MAVKQTPPDETAGSASDAPDTDRGPTEAETTATSRQGTTAGGSLGGDAAGRIPSDASGPGASGGAGSGGTGGPTGASSGAEPGFPSSGETGFFGWLRSLGVPRLPGWLGGVAAGVSARLAIDPIIVRGVLVVCALFGAPVFLLYGLAWLLLPDATGRIHLEQLFRGVFDKALVGIAILLLLALSPFGFSGNTFFGDVWDSVPYGGIWNSGPWMYGIPVLWTLLLIGGVTALVVWLVRRNRETGGAVVDGSTTPEAAFAQYEAQAEAAAAAADGAVAQPAASSEPAEPAPVAVGADEYEAWKAQHAAWRIDHEAWRQSQADANRAARARLAAENKARSIEFAARAEEARRIRRLTSPRTSFAAVVAALGAALVGGTIAAMIALGSPAQASYAGTIGLAVATIVVALSMVLAGALRRRSGFLSFVAIVLTVCTLGSAAMPRADQLILGDQAIPLADTTSYLMPAGTAYLVATDAVRSQPQPPRVAITQGAGNVYIEIYDGVRVHIEADYASGGWSSVFRVGPDGAFTATEPPTGLATVGTSGGGTSIAGTVGGTGSGSPDAFIDIRGLNGGVQVTIHEEDN